MRAILLAVLLVGCDSATEPLSVWMEGPQAVTAMEWNGGYRCDVTVVLKASGSGEAHIEGGETRAFVDGSIVTAARLIFVGADKAVPVRAGNTVRVGPLTLLAPTAFDGEVLILLDTGEYERHTFRCS